MSRARHEMEREKRASGGRAEGESDEVKSYTQTPNNVEKEAEEKKHGGRLRKKKKHGGEVEGEAMHRKHLGRPGRATGGKIGSNLKPLSTAAKVTPAEGHSDTMSGDASDANDRASASEDD